MHTLSLGLLLLGPRLALADVLTLDNGATLEGHLARYEHAGECELAVSAGELAGALVVVPCSRVVRMERSSPDGLGAPVAVAPLPPVAAPAPATAVTDAEAATLPVGAPTASEAVAPPTEPPPSEPPGAAAVAQADPPTDSPAGSPAVAEAEPASPSDAPAEATAPEEPAPERSGWRAALPEGMSLPALGRRRSTED